MIDLDATKAELERLLAIVNKRIQGTANVLPWPDLTSEEKAKVEALATLYSEARMNLNQWLDTVTNFIDLDVTTKMMELGANLPVVEVPQSMQATLDREYAEAEEIRSLFVTSPPAVAVQVTVSDPEPK